MPAGAIKIDGEQSFCFGAKNGAFCMQEMKKTLNGNGNGTPGVIREITKKTASIPAVASSTAAKESEVTFRTADGVELHGALARMTRHAVFFELYNPGSTPRLSETFEEFKIILQEQTVYSGRATVRNVLDTGTKIICETTLRESDWTDLHPEIALRRDGGLAREFKNFLNDWQKLYKVLPEFKVVVADMQTFLHGLRLWLDKLELGIRSFPEPSRKQFEKEAIAELTAPIVTSIDAFIGRFESVAAKLDEESRSAHQSHARRQLHPLLLCAPFLNRTFTKPLGYAGDYEMVNMILRDPLQGDSLYAKIINFWFLLQPPAEAHRNRIQFLSDRTTNAAARLSRSGRVARIVSLGCGPAHEVQKFLRESHLANHAEFTLLDFNPETLVKTGAALNHLKKTHGRTTRINMVQKSVNQILKEWGRKTARKPEEQYDLVYCAGLFDYLTDKVCLELTQALYEWVAPGGSLITTNVDASNPRRLTMDYIMEWHLIYRNQSELASLKPRSASPDLCKVTSDDTGVNIYFEAQKPHA
jgi:extracellular factor (EF) 3-hydroxypalmitic acid methyl ester biosynthesis protein